MDLKTFIATTLEQIVEGIAASQEGVAALGGASNPAVSSNAQHLPSFIGTTANNLSVYGVSFDVALTATSETGKEGGARVEVAHMFSVGGKVGTKGTEQTVSRIQFVVPIAMPPEAATTESKETLKAKLAEARTARRAASTATGRSWMAT